MAEQLRVDFEVLDRLLLSMRESYAPIAGTMYLDGKVDGFPKTGDALRKLDGEWDLRRRELLDGLWALTSALQEIRDTFDELDTTYAASLRGES